MHDATIVSGYYRGVMHVQNVGQSMELSSLRQTSRGATRQSKLSHAKIKSSLTEVKDMLVQRLSATMKDEDKESSATT